MKKLLMVIGVLALVGIGAIVAVFFAAKAELRPHAEKVLAACQEGRYEEVYKEASAAFRDSTPLGDFRAYMELRRRSLGAFKKVAGTRGGGMATSTSGPTTGTISMDLEYEKGPATGEFAFVKDGETWRLQHVKIDFDKKLLPARDAAALEPLSRELLGLYDASSFVALYARFSNPLKSAWKAEAYEPQIRELRSKTGKVVDSKLRMTEEEAGGNRVRLLFDVTFEAGAGEAAFAWEWANGWHLMAFNLHIGPR